jgi:hypothetical protein
MKKPKATRQLDIAWDKPKPFTLAVQTPTDGDRMALAKAQAIANQEQSEQLHRSNV